MRRKWNMLFKRSVAACLIAALAFIYAEKVFHRHEYISTDHTEFSYSQNNNYTSCSLCDFQPVTYAEIPDLFQEIFQLTATAKKFILSAENYSFSTLHLTNERGPPAFQG